MVLIALFCLSAFALKVPATVNIGIGPTVGTMGNPQASQWSPSWGVALMAEGYVDRKTLHSKKVMRRVPKQYRGMVRNMDDAHVVPLPVLLLPDSLMLAPIGSQNVSILPVSWAPIELSVMHKTKGWHRTAGLQLRGAYLRTERANGYEGKGGWFGATLATDIQSPYKERVGVALGGHAGPGAPLLDTKPLGIEAPWLNLGAYARLQLRFPIEVER